MLNDDNKNYLIKLVFEYVINEKQTAIPLLKTDVIVLSGDNECYTVTSGLVTANYELKCNQEEADTKVILHAIQIIQCIPFKLIIRNPSGDADIMILNDCNWIRTHNHLVHKRTLNHLAKLAQ